MLPDQKIDDLLRRCTVRVVATEQSGTGFFVAPGLILTCAQVVEGDEKARPPAMPIRIYWEDQPYAAQVEQFLPNPYPDIALLRVSFDEHPCVYLQDAIKLKDSLYSWGYPQDYPDGDSATFAYEGPTSDKDSLLKPKEGQASPGLSGAPLLNLRTDGVCGIVKRSRDVYTDLGGRAVPTKTVLSRFEELAMVQRRFHYRNRLWIEMLPFSSLAGQSETQDFEEAELIEELFDVRPIQSSGENIFHIDVKGDIGDNDEFFVRVHFNFWIKYSLEIISIDLQYSLPVAWPGPQRISIDGNRYEPMDDSFRMRCRRRIEAHSVADVFVCRWFVCLAARADYADYGTVRLNIEYVSPRWFGINVLKVVAKLEPGGKLHISELSLPEAGRCRRGRAGQPDTS